MPVVSIATCVFIGWALKPGVIIDEVTRNGEQFGRKRLYVVMIKYVTPVLLLILLQAIGVIPTFVFYAVLLPEIMRLLALPRLRNWAILSFNHRLSFR